MLEVCVLLSVTGRQWVSLYTMFSSVGSLCVTFSDWGDNGCPATRGVPLLEVCVLLSLTGRQWLSRYTRFSSVGSLCVTFSDLKTLGVPLYEVFLCWKFVCYFQ